MKKIISCILASFLLLSTVTAVGCGETDNSASSSATSADAKYTVSVTATSGGTATVNKTEVVVGGSVEVSVKPNEGYAVKSFIVNGTQVHLNGDKYLINDIIRDYTISVVFAKSDVTVLFKDEDEQTLAESKTAVFGAAFGELPVPFKEGKRFLGWMDENGNSVLETTTITQEGENVLIGKFATLTNEEKECLQPFAVTTSYYDAAATKYGVVWHTSVKPSYSVVRITEGETTKEVLATYEEWIYGEYVSSVVLENLKYNTAYSVQFGDKAANIWSETYTFTTREENPADAKFLFLTDTNQGTLAEGETTVYNKVLKNATQKFNDVDFLAHGGNAVSSKLDKGEWKSSLESVEEWLFTMPVMPVAGENVNSVANNYTVSYDIMSKLFCVDCPDERYTQHGIYYSFDYSPIHFISLRSNDATFQSGKLGNHQIEWLEKDLKAAKSRTGIRWIVVMTNEGPITASYKKGTTNYRQSTLGLQLLPLFTQYEVDLVLYGKNGHLGSSYPLVWDSSAQAATDGNTYKSVATTKADVWDGENVDAFEYANAAVRGTVYHQTGNVGAYKLPANVGYVDVDNYRKLLTGYKDAINVGEEYAMYSYIEAYADKLVLRTYGMETTKETSKYLDGFMLKK